MSKLRGRSASALVSVLAIVGAIGCGGSGDDDGAAPAAGASGTKSSGGSGGSSDSGGASGSGDKGGSGGTGGSSTGKGGSSAGAGKGGSSGASGGSAGSAGTSTADLLDAIGDACKTDCDNQFALACAPTTTNTLTCQLSCAASTSQLGDFCLEEYRDYVGCRGDGGYDCVNMYPYPRATCAVQQLAFSDCTQHIGCKRYCEKIQNLGCSDVAFDDCVQQCSAEDSTLPADCNSETETIAYCQATASTSCVGQGLDLPAACTSSVLNVAECIGNDSSDLCDGWCWAADRLGCGGSDCAKDCAAKQSPAACGSEWNSLLDCTLFFDEGSCEGGTLVGGDICQSEQQQYQQCVAGDGGTN